MNVIATPSPAVRRPDGRQSLRRLARDHAGLVDTSLPAHRLARQVLLVAAVALTAAPASAQSISANPGGSSVIGQAVDWLRGTLLGNVATGLAILAVAILGILAMTGRIEWSRAGLVILGIFILFGAVSIVSGIRGITGTTA